MSVRQTMTPEQIAQWEEDMRAWRALRDAEAARDERVLAAIRERFPADEVPFGTYSALAREFDCPYDRVVSLITGLGKYQPSSSAAPPAPCLVCGGPVAASRKTQRHRGCALVIHGKASTYVYRGCRCDLCREANRVRVASARQRRSLNIPDRVHGTTNGYQNYGCRCDSCRVVWGRHMADQRRRRSLRNAQGQTAT